MRNWSNFVWLSGDWMMEVACHEVDKIAWAMRDVPPLKCVATGGRATSLFGNVFDHFDVSYEYAGAMPAILKTRYQSHCFDDLPPPDHRHQGALHPGMGKSRHHGADQLAFEATEGRRSHDSTTSNTSRSSKASAPAIRPMTAIAWSKAYSCR